MRFLHVCIMSVILLLICISGCTTSTPPLETGTPLRQTAPTVSAEIRDRAVVSIMSDQLSVFQSDLNVLAHSLSAGNCPAIQAASRNLQNTTTSQASLLERLRSNDTNIEQARIAQISAYQDAGKFASEIQKMCEVKDANAVLSHADNASAFLNATMQDLASAQQFIKKAGSD